MMVHLPNPRTYGAFPVAPSAFRYLQKPLENLNQKYSLLLDNFLADPAVRLQLKKIVLEAKLAFFLFSQKNYSETDKHLKEMFIDITIVLRNPLKLTALFLATTALLIPITCLTPVSFAVDVLSGALEVRQAMKEGYHKEHIDLILQKKWFASGAQHAIFFTVNITYFMAARSLVSSHDPFPQRFLWTVLIAPIVSLSLQRISVIFTMRILKNNEWAVKLVACSEACLLHVFTYRYPLAISHCLLPSWIKIYPIFFHDLSFKGWSEFAQTERAALVVRNDGTQVDLFLKRYKGNVSPLELLELDSSYTEEDLKKAYKKWAMYLHPDKKDRDAEVLFKGLSTANQLLDKKLKSSDLSEDFEE